VSAPVKDTIVCLSSQDEKIEPLESNSQLNMRSYAPEDDEMLKKSNCMVTDKESEKSLFLSLDSDQKVHSQAEAEVQDIMVSTSCSISEILAQKITSKEQSFKKSIEVGDECFRPQDMDYVMMFDSSKDDNGPNPERMTAEGDCGDPHEGLDSVTLGVIGKNVVYNAIIEDVKSINPNANNVNHGELYVSLQLPEGNADSGMTGVSTASPDSKEGNIEKVVAGASAHEIDDINANGSSELKIGNTDSGITGVSTASSDLKVENVDKVVAADCAHENDINAKDDSFELKVADTDNCITGGSTVSPDESEGNTDQTIAGDCRKKTDLNADGEGADKYLATDSVLPCEDDATCTDGVILSLDVPCSTKNTYSDAEMPLLDGTCELVDRPSTPKDGMFENASFDVKRPASDRTLEENEVTRGDAKTERHYKRRKLLALEKQSSFSGETSTD
jgi:sentrin-specific protease 7